MPLYFFDTDDGEHRIRDDMGIPLADIDDVEREAVALLRDLAYFDATVGRHEMTATVRDQRDSVVYRGKMLIVGEWIEPLPATEAAAPRGGTGQERPSHP